MRAWPFTLLALWVFSVLPTLPAQEQTSSPEEDSSQGIATLRCFAELGERGGKTTYTLTYTSPRKRPDEPPATMFNGLNGGFCSNVGLGAIPMQPGRYMFVLETDGGGGKKTLSEVLKSGVTYSLLATLDGLQPELRLVQEFPLGKDELPGVVVHNLQPKAPLFLAIGEQDPVPVPFSKSTDFFLPSANINGPLVAAYSSERKTTRRRTIEHAGERTVAVFVRNGYGQLTIVSFPAKSEEAKKVEKEQ